MSRAPAPLTLSLLAALHAPAAALACSVASGYRPPSNYDLVRAADVIVLARSVGHDDRGSIRFKILKVIKGRWRRQLTSQRGHDGFLGRSDPEDFRRARPGAYAGSCIAMDYRLGQSYVLFCDDGGDELYVSGPPFTRVNEEVDGEESPWTQAVTLYSRVALLGDPEAEHRALQELLAKAQGGEDLDAIPRAVVQDLELHFDSPSPSMPWSRLVAMFEDARTDSARSRVLRAMAGCELGKDRERAADFLHAQLGREGWLRDLESYAQLIARTKDAQCVPKLAAAFRDQEVVALSLREAAQEEHRQLMLDLLQRTGPEPAALLVPWFVRHPGAQVEAVLTEKARLLRERVGNRYADHWHGTLALAALGQPGPVAWAKDDLDGKANGCCGMAMYILAWSPLPEADRLVGELIRENRGEELWQLLGGYERSPRPVPWNRIEEMVRLSDRHGALTARLQESLRARAQQGEERARELLALLELSRWGPR